MYDKILEENERRKSLYFRLYDPVFGDENEHVTERESFSFCGFNCLLPLEMFEDYPALSQMNNIKLSKIDAQQFIHTLITLRYKYDFEFWCYTCVKIQDKRTKTMIPFRLNYGQRKTVKEFEKQRLEGRPIRVIICKARQWGGSTVTQIYMLWLQTYHYKNWHSAIISQQKEQASNIRSMIQNVIAYYPQDVCELTIKSYNSSPYIKYIPQRGCKVQIGTAEEPDAIRSFDFSMLHMSEVGLWKSTSTKSAYDLAQSVLGIVPEVAGSFVVMESTAKGVGTFFHEYYQGAVKGTNEFAPVFVGWFEIENYAEWEIDPSDGQSVLRDSDGIPVSAIHDYGKLIKNFTNYDKQQWKQGATLEGIAWYKRYKQGKQFNDFQMKSEYPGTDVEAFQTKSNKFFEQSRIDYARSTCREPLFKCDIRGASDRGIDAMIDIHLDLEGYSEQGGMCVWIAPEKRKEHEPIVTNQYLVVCDIGGTSTRADWSVISVFDRSTLIDPHGALERAATWRGHIDHDMLAWKAVQIAKFYNNAMLVIESNTLETRDRSDETTYEGNHFYTVLDEIGDVYSNLYMRGSTPDKVVDKVQMKYGFHTNTRTKRLVYDALTKALRDGEYIERDSRVVMEMDYLENKPDGAIGAIKGQHDDLIDTAAIGAYISASAMDLPKEINPRTADNGYRSDRGGGFASF